MNIEGWFYSLTTRLRSLFHPNRVDQEMKEELREHLEQQIEENLARGMSPEEARYSAMRALGGIAQIEQQCRDARGGSALEDFVQDLRYGFRQLRRNPGFSALIILCLTLGIGANSAGSKGFYSVPIPPSPTRSGCLLLPELRAAKAEQEASHGRTSWICGEAARYARNISSARLPAAR